MEKQLVVSLENYNHSIAPAEICLNFFFHEFRMHKMESVSRSALP